MASMKLEEQLDEQPPEKKPCIDNCQEEGENASNPNESELPKSAEGDKETTNLPPSAGRHRKLPAELNQQIFLCFNPATQRKFISGLGWDFYAMFRYRLLTKSKRVCNPHGNRWNGINTRATISADGLKVSYKFGCPNVFAVQPFPVSGPQCRVDEFPGTICYYYEIKGQGLSMVCTLGLSDGAIPHNSWMGKCPNSYAILTANSCWLGRERHELQQGQGAIRPRWVCSSVNVLGCGLLLDPEDKLSIFFTLNGNLMGRKISIKPTVDSLFPAVALGYEYESSIEANFGDNPAKPFEYDIHNCPELKLACI